MGKKVRFTLLTMVLALGIFGAVYSAEARPDFLTLYNTTFGKSESCSLCHISTSPVQLNSTGQTFLNSGLNINSIAPSPPPAPPPPSTDTIPPTIIAFTVPGTSNSLTVSPINISASDNVGVTGYMVKESSTAPDASAIGWNGTPPASFTFAAPGIKTLYAWAKDAAGNVSTSANVEVTITLSTTTPPPSPSPPSPSPGATQDLGVWVGTWFRVTLKSEGYHVANLASQNHESSGMSKDQASVVGYLRIRNLSSDGNVLQGDLYTDDGKGGWLSESFPLQYIAGGDLNLLAKGEVTGDLAAGFVALIQGKSKGGVLKSATLKTLGGYYIDTGSQSGSPEHWAGKFSITGSLISESKVPVPSEEILH